jgi:hypothetical protein
MADEEYVEVDAVVRMPKGERLADSRTTEGWSRGFTPKSSDKGPEHVEIRLKDAARPVTSADLRTEHPGTAGRPFLRSPGTGPSDTSELS